MYVAYIQPLVKKHETKIDNAISEVERSYQTQVRPGTSARSPLVRDERLRRWRVGL